MGDDMLVKLIEKLRILPRFARPFQLQRHVLQFPRRIVAEGGRKQKNIMPPPRPARPMSIVYRSAHHAQIACKMTSPIFTTRKVRVLAGAGKRWALLRINTMH